MLRRELFTQAIDWSPTLAALWIALQEERKKNSQRNTNAWQDKSPLERIRILESGNRPAGINVEHELILATAQIGCPTLACTISPEEIAANTFFFDSEQFIQAIEHYNGSPLPTTFRNEIKTSGIEVVTKETSPRQTFFNEPQFRRYASEMRAQMETDTTKFAPILKLDPGTFARKCVLFHAQAHLVETTRPLAIEPMPVVTRNIQAVDRLKGFTLLGTTADGQPVLFNGASEAMTEMAAMIAAHGSGYYASLPYYQDGLRIVRHLNNRVGISDKEFIDYYNGTRNQEELLARWGRGSNRKASDLEMGAYALYVTAMVNDIHPLMSMDQAVLALTNTGFINP